MSWFVSGFAPRHSAVRAVVRLHDVVSHGAGPATLLLLAVLPCAAVAIQKRAPPSAGRCVLIHESGTSTAWQSDPAACATRLSPASTFKIPHALVALETGVVHPDTVERWDGTKHPNQPHWDEDHTVVSAMRPSVLWFFQRIAPRVGAERMRGWLRRMRYGNADTSGSVTEYWVNGTLRISPLEQVEFLRQFYAATLPIAPVHQRLIRDALNQKGGWIENARGVHQLAPEWPHGAQLNAKTGATTIASGQRVSWLVGALTAGGRDHMFASAVWGDAASVDGLDGARLAFRTFVERGLLRAAGTR
jgi:beta-lactamase class D